MPVRDPSPGPEGYSPVQWAVLASRGVGDAAQAAELLRPEAGPTHDPFLLSDMAAAVARIRRAIGSGERIAVYGDYDADGLTAAALLSRSLEALGARVAPFIPSRFEEGYGLEAEALGRLAAEGCRLVISVDCGARAVGEALVARELGLDLIITDHHEPGPSLPQALAVINPKRPGDEYPFKELSGVGLAYKLAEALAPSSGSGSDGQALAYVAVGTIADLAPLVDENRTLCARGLAQLRASPPPGLAALIEVGGLRRERITARDIGFSIGPRLNAAGRLGSPQAAFGLLRAETLSEGRPLAESLDRANRERQDKTNELLKQTRERLMARGDVPALIFDADPEYGEGLLGPAASKLVEEWSRPAVLVSVRGNEARGSARSVTGFHITQALEACAPLLEKFGGHAAAAGFSLPTDRLADLRRELEGLAAAGLQAPGIAAPLEIDVVVEPEEIDWYLLGFLDRLEPMGQGFPPPLFACLGMTVTAARPVGREQAHLKLSLRRGGRTVEAIAFRQGRAAPARGEVVDVAFYAERESYQGLESVRWNVQRLRTAA